MQYRRFTSRQPVLALNFYPLSSSVRSHKTQNILKAVLKSTEPDYFRNVLFHSFFLCLEVDAAHSCTVCTFHSVNRIVYRDRGQVNLNSRSCHVDISARSCTPTRTPQRSRWTAISCFCCQLNITR